MRGDITAPPPAVLIVDDEPVVRRVLELYLRRCGFVVWAAAGGREAVELYRQHFPAVDVVLLDVRMPGMDGPATFAALREIDPAVRCCFMSGESGAPGVADLLSQGARHFFPKPFASLATVGAVLSRLATDAAAADTRTCAGGPAWG